MSKGIVISLYDYTGEALKPWAMNGYTCYAFDIQHEGWTIESYGNKNDEHVGSIHYRHADLHINSPPLILTTRMIGIAKMFYRMLHSLCLLVLVQSWFPPMLC